MEETFIKSNETMFKIFYDSPMIFLLHSIFFISITFLTFFMGKEFGRKTEKSHIKYLSKFQLMSNSIKNKINISKYYFEPKEKLKQELFINYEDKNYLNEMSSFSYFSENKSFGGDSLSNDLCKNLIKISSNEEIEILCVEKEEKEMKSSTFEEEKNTKTNLKCFDELMKKKISFNPSEFEEKFFIKYNKNIFINIKNKKNC